MPTPSRYNREKPDELSREAFADRLAATETQLGATFDSAGMLLQINHALESMFERLDATSIGARGDGFARLLAGTTDGAVCYGIA